MYGKLKQGAFFSYSKAAAKTDKYQSGASDQIRLTEARVNSTKSDHRFPTRFSLYPQGSKLSKKVSGSNEKKYACFLLLLQIRTLENI